MTTVSTITDAIESLAPLHLAESWDKVGLLIGRRDAAAKNVMLAIDLTEAVTTEAIEAGVGLIVAYHPPIFAPLTSVTDRTWKERNALRAIEAGIAVYSPHTALDAAPDGVNDWLAGAFGPGATEALVPRSAVPESEAYKVVTFCPETTVDAIRVALAQIGAGRIANYTHCSFELRGQGTFVGGPGTDPAVGRKGRLERVDEVRLEMVCPESALASIERVLRAAHPYEEAPIEIHALVPRPAPEIGPGRRSVLDRPTALGTLATHVKKTLGVKSLRIASGPDVPKRITTVGVCAGAGGSLIGDAIASGCDLFLTGEAQHHDLLDAVSRGCAVMLAGHTNTERGYLKVLRTRLAKSVPSTKFLVSRRDVCPWKDV